MVAAHGSLHCGGATDPTRQIPRKEDQGEEEPAHTADIIGVIWTRLDQKVTADSHRPDNFPSMVRHQPQGLHRPRHACPLSSGASPGKHIPPASIPRRIRLRRTSACVVCGNDTTFSCSMCGKARAVRPPHDHVRCFRVGGSCEQHRRDPAFRFLKQPKPPCPPPSGLVSRVDQQPPTVRRRWN